MTHPIKAVLFTLLLFLGSFALVGWTDAITRFVLLEDLQESEFVQKGEYLQIRDDIDLAQYINVYKAPCGDGYQIADKKIDRIDYYGYGCLEGVYTYSIYKNIEGSASSTKEI